jgi:hypothetical protein
MQRKTPRARKPAPGAPAVEQSAPSVEDLISRLRDIEALAHAAAQALQGLPHTPDPAARLAAGRLFSLVMMTAETASSVLAITGRASA